MAANDAGRCSEATAGGMILGALGGIAFGSLVVISGLVTGGVGSFLVVLGSTAAGGAVGTKVGSDSSPCEEAKPHS